jgi:hypothetical protein
MAHRRNPAGGRFGGAVTSRVLVVGFDACEVTLIEREIAAGRLPNFAKLRDRSLGFHLANPMETLPGAIWPEINTGVSSGTMGHFYIPNQLRTGEARLRATRAADIDASKYYWAHASSAGCRVAVLDPVQAVPVAGLNGIQLFEWGLHDRTFDVSSDPPELLDGIRAEFGDHPIHSCDVHGQTPDGYRRLLDGLLKGLRASAGIFSRARFPRAIARAISSGISRTRDTRGTTRPRRRSFATRFAPSTRRSTLRSVTCSPRRAMTRRCWRSSATAWTCTSTDRNCCPKCSSVWASRRAASVRPDPGSAR